MPDPDLEIRVGAGGGGGGVGAVSSRPLDNGGQARSPKIFFGLKIRGGGPPGPLPASATEYPPTFIIIRLIHVLLKELCHEGFQNSNSGKCHQRK